MFGHEYHVCPSSRYPPKKWGEMVELYPSGFQGMLFKYQNFPWKWLFQTSDGTIAIVPEACQKKLFEKGLLRSGIVSPTRVPGMLFKYLNFHENDFFKLDI